MDTSVSLDFDSQTPQTVQASPITVRWLIENFEPADGCSLRRSTLYDYYIYHCKEQKIDPVNPASFGKLIRSVFLGLKTRRLGTRGNSKYHYYGIRVKINSPLNNLPEDFSYEFKYSPVSMASGDATSTVYQENFETNQTQNIVEYKPIITNLQETNLLDENKNETSLRIPFFTSIDSHLDFGQIRKDNLELPPECNLEDVRKFEEIYKHHFDKILDWVISLKLEGFKEVWLAFWRCTNNFNFYEEQLPSSKFFALCNLPQVISFIKNCDYLFYQFCIEILIPDVLGVLPPSLVLSLRHLSKNIENWLRIAMSKASDRIKEAKLPIVNTFAITLRRYTSLNHITQTVKASLQNEQILAQMMADLGKVDFSFVQNQARWVFNCDQTEMIKIESEFKETLRNFNLWNLESWTSWLEGIVNRNLHKYEGTDRFERKAKKFMLIWSFVGSLVVRDLTLRSAHSFGSFHLIRLFFEEYLYYCIEHKIANNYRRPILEILGECDFRFFN